MKTKKCVKCHIEKSLESFYLDKSAHSKDGRKAHCNQCDCLQKKLKYPENKEKLLERSREWKRKNPEKVRLQRKLWDEKNPHKISEWYHKKKNEGRCTECGKVKAINTTRCSLCYEKLKIDIKNRNLRLKKMVMEHYGNKCNCCNESNLYFLTIDHMNNDGNKRRKAGEGLGPSLYRWIIKNNYPHDLQILCANCQLGKRINKGICPHRGESNSQTSI